MVKLKGHKDVVGVTVDGKEYPVKHGIVEVPDEVASKLIGKHHGWQVCKPEKADKQ